MTSATLSTSRLAGVHGLRAFAAMWVVLFHTTGTGITRASRLVSEGIAPQDRVVAATVLAIPVVSLVVSYVGVALVAGRRVTALIGMSLGVLGPLRLPQQ